MQFQSSDDVPMLYGVEAYGLENRSSRADRLYRTWSSHIFRKVEEDGEMALLLPTGKMVAAGVVLRSWYKRAFKWVAPRGRQRSSSQVSMLWHCPMLGTANRLFGFGWTFVTDHDNIIWSLEVPMQVPILTFNDDVNAKKDLDPSRRVVPLMAIAPYGRTRESLNAGAGESIDIRASVGCGDCPEELFMCTEILRDVYHPEMVELASSPPWLTLMFPQRGIELTNKPISEGKHSHYKFWDIDLMGIKDGL